MKTIIAIICMIVSMLTASNKPVIMPDGTETTPARYFNVEDINDVFISWYDVKGEIWPGETA